MNKGGARKGAGRPALDSKKKKIPVSVLLPPDLIDALDAMPESRAALIEKACRAYYKISPAG